MNISNNDALDFIELDTIVGMFGTVQSTKSGNIHYNEAIPNPYIFLRMNEYSTNQYTPQYYQTQPKYDSLTKLFVIVLYTKSTDLIPTQEDV